MGGKASNQQMLRWVIENMQLSEVQIGLIRAGKRTELEYRLAWARTAARKKGLIDRVGPSIWSLKTDL